MNQTIYQYKNFYFIGIAGTGMSAIAQYLNGLGLGVSGSDRLFASSPRQSSQQQFEQLGIACFVQDGSGLTPDTGVVVISTAIEESNLELVKARQLGIPVMKRSELLALISSGKRTIAVGGTSGKSTTTAMIFHILQQSGYDPSLITGAGLSALQKKGLPGNAWVGQSDWLVIECDESDGSIVNYLPEIAVLLNIDRDHKELNELLGLFDTFKKNTRGFFITNVDHETSRSLSAGSAFDFGTSPSARVMAGAYRQDGFNISFTINHVPFAIPVPGRHNMENASAASAVALAVGVSLQQSARALASYEGIYRRTQLVGRARGVCVVDDFAHNPAEVVAAIRACQNIAPRVLAWFQPHGYGPLSFMHNELIDGVCGVLRHSDKFYMSDVFYAGGTVVKSVTSEMVVARMRERSANIVYESQRDDIATHMVHAASPGDIVLLMGARDTTLSDFAGYVLRVLES